MKFLYLCVLMTLHISLYSQGSSSNAAGQQAEEWVKNKAWAPAGFSLNVHPSTDKQEFARQYMKNKALWDKAFSFLKDNDLDKIAPGKYPLDSNNAYVTVTEGASKELDKTNWESHRKYIDLQYIARGKEKIGVAPVSAATVTKAYDEAKDVANYIAEGQYYVAEPGTFFLFFAQNAHRPSILVDGFSTVKKVVVKIRAAE